LLDIFSTAINLNPPRFGTYTSSSNDKSIEVIYSFPTPNTGQTFNRICLFKRDFLDPNAYRVQQVVFQAPYFIIGVNLSQPFFDFGDLLYYPNTNTIYEVTFTNGFYAIVDPPIPNDNYSTNFITNYKYGNILQTEAITPRTLSGQQLTFKWTIENGNSPT
ncbi:MAG: hypothetical protein ACRCU6_10195, partial [Fusobacteriaceae bacterium]